jgi:hypothetical protein
MQFLDPNHPFFRPVWRRWATGLLPLIWGGVELFTGNPGWAILFGGAGAYALYMLVLKGPDT